MKNLLLLVFSIVVSTSVFGEISKECGDNKECIIELPGSKCADGTPSYMTLTKRPNAKQLLVFMHGGGACWSKATCDAGYARPLTREETPTDWTNGGGIFNSNESQNPFAKDYNVVTIPYCTGDGHLGNRTIDYGGRKMEHRGYENVRLAMAKAKELYPSPERVALVGCSAGGMGTLYHLRTVRENFPSAMKYVVDDAGVPFKAPHVSKSSMQNIMKNWGTDLVLPIDSTGQAITEFGTLIRENVKFGDTKFGLIASYRDKVMTFFALGVGTMKPFSVVHDVIIDVGDNDIGRDTANAKVFYTESNRHCHTGENIAEIKSQGESLGEWLTAMTEEKSTWKNIRPDLNGPVGRIEHFPEEAAQVNQWLNQGK